MKELIDDYAGDLQVLEDGTIKYSFNKIMDQLEAGQLARETVKKTTVFGKTIFSSDPEELSPEQSEIEDFEKKLKG